MTRERALYLLNIYKNAWVTRDPDLITTIFSEDATYDDPHEPKNIGREAIRKYWKTKVVSEQKNIKFELKNLWIDGDTVIAEWQAEFTDTKRALQIKLDEIAVFSVQGDMFGSLREYYTSTKEPL